MIVCCHPIKMEFLLITKNDLHQQNIYVKEIYMENPRIYHNVRTPTLWSHIRQGYHQIILGTHSKVSAKTPHNEISAKSKHKFNASKQNSKVYFPKS